MTGEELVKRAREPMTTPIDELAGLARAEHLIANYLFNEDGESEEWLTEALELVQAALAHAAPERLDEATAPDFYPDATVEMRRGWEAAIRVLSQPDATEEAGR